MEKRGIENSGNSRRYIQNFLSGKFLKLSAGIKGISHKKAVAVETIVWWVIAIAVLVVMVIFAAVLKDKLWEIGKYLKNLF
jgi:hypothetical protein